MYMVSIYEILVLVAEGGDCCVSLLAHCHRLCAYYLMLAVGLVPNGYEMYSELLLGLDESLELVDAFMGETVADTE